MPDYLHIALWGGASVREQMFGQVIGQTRPGLNGAIIKRLVIPVPPLDEQVIIINSVNAFLSFAENAYPEIVKQEKRSNRLRQSILKKAFSGQLVPSANDYESGITHEMSMATEAGAPYGTKA